MAKKSISSVFVVDRQTGNSLVRMSPKLTLMLMQEGRVILTNPGDSLCNTVYLLADKPAEKQAISAMFGAALDPLRSIRACQTIGSLDDYFMSDEDVMELGDARYGMPVLPTIGYDRTTAGHGVAA